MDISWTLNALIPAAQYGGSLTDNTQEAYDKILWEDTRTKPSWQDLTSEWPNHEDHIVWGTLRSNRNCKKSFAVSINLGTGLSVVFINSIRLP